ncbi:MAG: hypothetical protein N2Z22_06205, partial [Turneriella sp.]|nr:hypothetical protein [Turneriella sp.]
MNLHVMKLKWVSIIGSLILLVGLLLITFYKYGGFALGIDFAGGIKIELKKTEQLTIASLRSLLEKE